MTFERWGVPVALGDGRVLHPGMLRWLRALGWMVLSGFVCALAFALPHSGMSALLPDTEPAAAAAVSVGAVVALIAYWLLVRFGEAREASEIALKAAPLGLALGLVIGTAMFSSVMGLMAVFGLYDIVWSGRASPWQAITGAIQSGVLEELIIRAVMLRLLWRAFGPWAAFAVSAAFFGAAHLANPNATPFAALCIAIEAGIMLGAFYALTGRLWVSIGVHAAWNFTQGYLFGAAVSGTGFGPAIAHSTARAGVSEILTGGAFGPEASLPGLFVGTLVGVVVMVMAWKAGRFAKPVVEVAPAVGPG